MATAASKAASFTTLRIGTIEVPVGLFSTVEKPGKTPGGWTTAGPNGGVLKARAVAQPVPVDVPADEPEQPAHSDPLQIDSAGVVQATERILESGALAPLAPRDPGEVIAEAIDGKRPMDDDAVLDAMDADRAARPIDPGPTHTLPAAQPPDVLLNSATVDGEYGRELVEEGTGEVVKPEDVRRGVRLEDGTFIDCTEQLAEIDERTRLEAMDVVAFIDDTTIPRSRVKGTYYVGVGDEQPPRALRVIYAALKATRRAAVVKLTKRSRQSLGAISAQRGVLVLYELVWAEDFRPPPERATRIQGEILTPEEIEAASRLVHALSDSPRVMDDLRDDAIALREELLEKARRGEVPDVLVPARSASQDVMAQLEASLAAAGS